jgi:hypothetical protein
MKNLFSPIRLIIFGTFTPVVKRLKSYAERVRVTSWTFQNLEEIYFTVHMENNYIPTINTRSGDIKKMYKYLRRLEILVLKF